MSGTLRHLLEQGPGVRALLRTGVSALWRVPHGPPPAAPGPWLESELPPRSTALVAAYLRHVGGDPAAYRGHLPPHLFPQWGFALAARALRGAPYPLARVMNAGCRIRVQAPLPAGEPLRVRARIESIDDDGRRALIAQRIVTGTRSAPDALDAELRAYVPLPGRARTARDDEGAPSRARPRVAMDARRMETLEAGPRAGWEFATLTGDVNPVHWIPAYARASGFRTCILHGFSTMARALEAVVRHELGGEPRRLAFAEVRFTRPLLLPARTAVHITPAREIFVGDAPGAEAYLVGRVTITEG